MRKLSGAFLLVGSVTAIGLAGGAQLTQMAMAQGADPYRELDTLARALHHIEDQYLQEVDTTSLIFGAIDGMTDALDRHSVFLDPDELAEAQVRTEGVYSGIGLELKRIAGQITVARVVPSSPADNKVARGEVLIAVDGSDIETLSEAGERLRGADGSSVKLTLLRNGETRELELSRTRIRDRTVRVSDLGSGWSYAEISRFQRNTATDLERGLRSTSPQRGVIIDLRGNGGGLLEEAVDVVDLFADTGLIVQTKGRGGTLLESHSATPATPYGKLKIIVLIDGESASASEIVAGSLRTLCSATLLGTATYGKWSVQRLYVFESKSAIKLTIAKYEISDQDAGTDQQGLRPDVLVERPSETRLAIAALERTLSSDDAALAHLKTLAANDDGKAVPLVLAPLTQRLTLDPQMKAAWTLARSNR